MKTKITLLVFLLLCFRFSSAQQSMMNIWYFGHHAGIDFANGAPIALSNGQIDNGEGCSVVSDNSGNLLFYTDGQTIWNRNHTIMPNGSGLSGNYSATQTVIVKKPSNCLQFYVFYESGQDDLTSYYSVVDMTLDGGLGDVIPSTKNTFMYYPATEKMTAVTHQNGNDVWVIMHEYYTDKFMSYLVTNTGINAPVNSNVGTIHDDPIGYMKASHSGNKLAVAISFTPNFDLCDFDKATGVVFNAIHYTDWNCPYGLEFSPNDNLLYVSSYWGTNYLSQIDVATGIQQTIATANNGDYDMNALQLGPDGKIYMARGNQNYLSVINDPNLPGTACNFITNAVTLAPGTYGVLGLPNFNQGEYNFLPGTFTYSQYGCGTYNFFSSVGGSFNSLSWNFGDINSGSNNNSNAINPQHAFSSPGNYNVILIVYTDCGNDTVMQQVPISNSGLYISLGNDTSVCTGSQVTFNAGLGYASYSWSTGASTSSITVNNNGTYSVTATDNNGCSGSDQVSLTNDSGPDINLGNDITICNGENIMLDAGSGNNIYHWQDGSSTEFLDINIPGTYWVEVTDNNGCKRSDTVHVSLGSDSLDIIVPNVFTPDGDGFNDKFEIKNLNLAEANLKIYNRWGKLVYESNSTADFWDGKRNGRPCSDGVYFWILEYQNNCYENPGKKYKNGIVHLLR